MTTEERLALAQRIVTACRGETDTRTTAAIAEVALAVGSNGEVTWHAQPIFYALSLTNVIADGRGRGKGLAALELVLAAIEREKATR